MLLPSLILPTRLAAGAAFLAAGVSALLTQRRRLQRAVPLSSPLDDGGLIASPSVAPYVHRQPRPGESYPSLRAPRVRTGRLPLPRRVAELTPADEPALASVDAFVDRLAELPLQEWLATGRGLIADQRGALQRAAAFAVLQATIDAAGLAVAAWYARDAVETSAFLASRGLVRWTRTERREFAAACAAARDAALALLAHDRLSPAAVASLVAPYACAFEKD